jgi:hypothetical protein
MAKWLTISETSAAIGCHLAEPPQVSTLITAQIDRDRTSMLRTVTTVNGSGETPVGGWYTHTRQEGSGVTPDPSSDHTQWLALV